MITLKLADSRTIRVTDEILWEYGRVLYRVDKVGSFSIERDHYGTIDDRANSLHIAYGRVETEQHPPSYGNPVLPDAPVINGVTIANGGCGFDPVRLLEDLDGGKYFQHEWPVSAVVKPSPKELWRPDAGRVSDVTRKRVKYICVALTAHYFDRPEYQAVERARARYLAPTRLRQHHDRIGELRQNIATLQAELADQMLMADQAADLTAPTVAAG